MLSPDLALELRASRPPVSPELRDRVRAVAENAAPPRRPFVFPSLGRIALVGATAAVAVGLGVAAVHGLTHSGSPAREAAPEPTAAVDRTRVPGLAAGGSEARSLSKDQRRTATSLPASPSRLQQYGASLRIQVKDREALSEATKRAMRFARLLGGYVASVQYSAPRRGQGAAVLVVRVPVDRVQDAIDEYAALGTILRQKLQITDVTKAVAEQAKEIARLRADVARLEAGGITAAERPRYEVEKARLDYLTKKKRATVRRAELARVSLSLVTKPKAAAVPASRFERTLGDAGGVLVREGEILLYALIVAGPLLLLGAAAIGAARLAQRRRDAQLLERS